MRRRLSVLLLAVVLTGCANRPTEPGLRLVGTEPFWGGTLTRDRLTIAGVDRPEIAVRNPGVRACAPQACFFGNFRDPGPRYVNAVLPDGRRLSLRLDPAPCSDGMSDRRYPYVANLTLAAGPGQVERLTGCAGPQTPFPGARR
jgi:uncharacterized membrane protein